MPVFSDVNLNIFVSFSEANQHFVDDFVGRRILFFLRPRSETLTAKENIEIISTAK